jgi:response regulator RpfG family c-di-GMP phosphodiesterase
VGAHDELKANFNTTIRILSSMIAMRAGHARRIAAKMGLDGKTTQEVFIAALLHEIGKIGFSDALLAIPVSQIAGESPHVVRKHPVRAEQLLMPLGELRGAATIVRSHMERYDDAGFPDALVGDAIPLGARIIGQVRDFEEKNATQLRIWVWPLPVADVAAVVATAPPTAMLAAAPQRRRRR